MEKLYDFNCIKECLTKGNDETEATMSNIIKLQVQPKLLPLALLSSMLEIFAADPKKTATTGPSACDDFLTFCEFR